MQWVKDVLHRLQAVAAPVPAPASASASAQQHSPALTSLLASPVAMGSYFHPRALLTALCQVSARAYHSAGVPDSGLASLRLCALFTPSALAPLAGALGGALLPLPVRGLQLQGGSVERCPGGAAAPRP